MLCASFSATMSEGHKTIRECPDECSKDGEGSRKQDI